MNQGNELEGHWLGQVRDFVEDALQETLQQQARMQDVQLQLQQADPLEETVPSAWVDGGSTYLDLIGGSLYVVRAATGLFRADEPIVWHTRSNVGFTTLPRDVDRYVGIQRDILEIECILDTLAEQPKFVVLDNGLASYATMGVPHSTLRYFTSPVPDDSPEFEYFNEFVRFMRRFDVLIQQCQILGIPLIGATKDPRSRAFARSLGLGNGINDVSAIAMLAGNRTGFTESMEAGYLEVPRVKEYLEQHSILTDGRGDFMRMFGILKPHARVFRVDFLESQQEAMEQIRSFVLSMHDGNGYLLPSHVVHRRAMISQKLSDSLLNLIMSRIAKENMSVAQAIFGSQRRSRFG
jgi:hypothetical protein